MKSNAASSSLTFGKGEEKHKKENLDTRGNTQGLRETRKNSGFLQSRWSGAVGWERSIKMKMTISVTAD